MKLNILSFMVGLAMLCVAFNTKKATKNNPKDMIIRISEIEIVPEYLDEYLAILKKESSASVKLELGVISIYPMFRKENKNEIRILEIYANKSAYEAHLQTEHFKHYKESTLKMVTSLKLVDMRAIDPETMPLIFEKLQ